MSVIVKMASFVDNLLKNWSLVLSSVWFTLFLFMFRFPQILFFFLFFTLSLAVCFAVEGWFWSSFARLGNGVSMSSSLNMSVFESGATWFFVDITNPSAESMSLRFVLVPQIITPDGLGNSGCDMVNWWVFSTYFTGNFSPVTLAPGETQRKRVDFNFPGCLSGIYQWCFVQSPLNDTSLGDADLVLGKVNFVRFDINPDASCVPLSIKVYPGSRTKGDFSNKWELRFYDTHKQLIFSGSIQTNILGMGNLQQNIAPGTYYVVYKGQSHLASYLSGIQVIDGQSMTLDFTTGNIYSAEDGLWGLKYQTAGDLRWAAPLDFVINGIDLSILISSGIIDQGVSVLDPKNLNGDGAINTADIGVLGNNFVKVDPFWSDAYHVGVNMFNR